MSFSANDILIVNKMFCPLPDEKTKIVVKNKNHTSKKNRRSKRKHKQVIKRHTKLASSMSSWAQNFTFAASWQLKQQVAYWKARAKSLEYENSVLHDVIRKNQCVVATSPSTENDEFESRDVLEMDEIQTENEMENEDRIVEGEDFEVSEEFINFLTANAKYKEDAKRERERLRVQLEEEESQSIFNEETQETSEEKIERMKELYGDKYQRISALEVSLLSSFIHETDKNKPSYWPNIPFNFNAS